MRRYKRGILVISAIFVLAGIGVTQEDINYTEALKNITHLLENTDSSSFKKAVFEVEQAYFEGALDIEEVNWHIRFLTTLAFSVQQTNDLAEPYERKYTDTEAVKKSAGIFHVLKDSTVIHTADDTLYHLPYTYDFDDFFGDKDWSKMFVSKLIETGSGNCHSFPYLFKILANELGVKVNLAVAPNHIYIKHHSQKTGWYNVELTSGTFPIDAWMMASGFVTMDAIRSGIFMKALNEGESIALCLVDLARGYDKKYPDNDGTFIEKCTGKALKYFPECVDAMLVNAEILKKRVQTLMSELSIEDVQVAKTHPKIKDEFLSMQSAYANIHQLGFRQMPKEMYMEWLMSVQEEKYRNNKVGH